MGVPRKFVCCFCGHAEAKALVFTTSSTDAHDGELVSFFACAAEQHEVLLGSSRLLVELNDLGCAFRSLCGHDLSHKKRGLDYQPPFCHPAGRGVVLAYAIAVQFLM